MTIGIALGKTFGMAGMALGGVLGMAGMALGGTLGMAGGGAGRVGGVQMLCLSKCWIKLHEEDSHVRRSSVDNNYADHD